MQESDVWKEHVVRGILIYYMLIQMLGDLSLTLAHKVLLSAIGLRKGSVLI